MPFSSSLFPNLQVQLQDAHSRTVSSITFVLYLLKSSHTNTHSLPFLLFICVMFYGVIFFSMLAAIIEARFNQAQESEAIQKIIELGDLGLPGDAANLGAECSQTLLLAANPCDSL